jgi:Secretion system C-terminal sorting domain
MKKKSTLLLKALAISTLFIGSLSAQTQIQMALPAQTTLFTGNVRGYWFTAPTCFTITGLEVPASAGSGLQSIAVVRFQANPPLFTSTTNNFTTLYLTQNNTASGIIAVNIQVEQGDVIGILGCRGTTNSYAAGAPFPSTIKGLPISLGRLGMQFQLPTNVPQDLFSEASGAISRVNMYYDTLINYSVTSTSLTPNSFLFADGSDSSFTSVWNYNDGSPLDSTWHPSHTFTSSGLYNVCSYITNSCGTDTVCTTINLCLPISSSQSITKCFGQSYSINGNTYNSSGTYTDTLNAINGCDSIVTTNLTIAPQITSSQTIKRCSGQSYTINGNTYTASGTYSDTLTAANVCDSIVTTNLTIASPITGSQTITRCAGQSYTFNGNTYSTSGVYKDTLTAVNSCDSIVTTNLTISPLIIISQTITKCFGQTFTVGNNTYSASGVYTDTITVAGACNNIVITNLTIKPLIVFTQFVNLCVGSSITVGTNVYNFPGSYLDTLIANNGCDSIVITNFTFRNSSINIGTTLSGSTIFSNSAINTTHQWINCNTNTPIIGANVRVYIATANGNYAVIVTDQFGCSDTSACVSITSVGIAKIVANNKISIYPNPNNSVFTIATDFNTEITIYDALGREVMKQNINAGKTIIDLNKEITGVYYIKMKNAQSQITKRIVVNK